MPQFRLNHVCYRKGCEGSTGDTIKVTDADAQWLLSHGGGVVVAAEAEVLPEGDSRGDEPKDDGKPSRKSKTKAAE